MGEKTEKLLSILKLQPVVPVLIVDDAKSAVPLARALVAGGLKAIEITMRTPAALEAVRAVAAEVEGAEVGAGTILNVAHWEAAVAAGSKFIVSPGTTQELLDAAADSDVPLLPGAATASEVMALREEGYQVLKFFPAEQAGGAAYLKALSSPLAGTLFCPTGGISLKNADDYLSLPNVICVGGSWVAPKELVAAGDWAGITKLAAEAAALKA
ncbi:2-dehydro-3-deoxy-phosphogluconate aldolase [Rhizobium leguminosarum bv. trifolii]|jgi:2-dehydro-3-deoxyphosphogluconate aldolase/(4S)-4-hydroxy-2-oxoglutarate aldolase|uniref:2-dehydro-3-deoxy-phosphogluconate aldolase n=1 Tax=Rhizobium ruizarguesonis TaxID=2081791 RepID=A0AAE8QF38_9HYPH|nr:2-dehydro-3-deoxy-phosphogluconate aldolase [Rhizobium ruizarguesonis]MBY5805276.1 2-dehydro-3-deoxy-phosphogluconate aldolase [Rhizobium leguminosarum]NKL14291.1 2-dehydro-3-deoxy-phosphogluconate aldolase [Rhizobium leguminosarum bv. viciae]QIO46271.1 2-dehydro-3-deoxy-phosphogluconate aldolase [Rhizobium leguminosarum bv. trifolii]MBY5845706.1 2-dehydro-3-deoxy-phosphogluconate aldolase [Rhizobium leguminosarum]MBY5881350.1 2-dehydro-3-deoxy-phosphogluconate aldolase [Rhizobium leguminos